MKKLLLALITVTGAASLHGMEPQRQLSPISLAQTYHQFLHSDPALPQDVTQQIFSLQLKAHLTDLEQDCKDPEDFVGYIASLLNSCGYQLASELCKHYFSHAKISICDIKDKFGKTALHYAALNSQTEIAKLLLNTAGDNAWTLLTIHKDGGETALHTAVYGNSTGVVKLLLNAAGDNTLTLLTMRNTFGQTALHTAAVNNNRTEIVKLLLNTAGHNAWTLLTMQNNSGYTALHYAASYNHIEIAELLLNAAGDKVKDFITIPSKNNKTALDKASFTSNVRDIMKTYFENNKSSQKRTKNYRFS